MGLILRKLKKDLAKLSAFTADDAAYVQSIEKAYHDAMDINDCVDRYAELNKIYNTVKPGSGTGSPYALIAEREGKIEARVTGASKNFFFVCVLGAFASMPLSLAVLGSFATRSAPVLLFGLLCPVLVYSFIAGKELNRINKSDDAAIKILRDNFQPKIDTALKPVADHMLHLELHYDAVKAYARRLDEPPPTEFDIRHDIKKQFNTVITPLTADDMTGTVEPEAKKPTIKLKKYGSNSTS